MPEIFRFRCIFLETGPHTVCLASENLFFNVADADLFQIWIKFTNCEYLYK